jgi:hypothetical protein
MDERASGRLRRPVPRIRCLGPPAPPARDPPGAAAQLDGWHSGARWLHDAYFLLLQLFRAADGLHSFPSTTRAYAHRPRPPTTRHRMARGRSHRLQRSMLCDGRSGRDGWIAAGLARPSGYMVRHPTGAARDGLPQARHLVCCMRQPCCPLPADAPPADVVAPASMDVARGGASAWRSSRWVCRSCGSARPAAIIRWRAPPRANGRPAEREQMARRRRVPIMGRNRRASARSSAATPAPRGMDAGMRNRRPNRPDGVERESREARRRNTAACPGIPRPADPRGGSARLAGQPAASGRSRGRGLPRRPPPGMRQASHSARCVRDMTPRPPRPATEVGKHRDGGQFRPLASDPITPPPPSAANLPAAISQPAGGTLPSARLGTKPAADGHHTVRQASTRPCRANRVQAGPCRLYRSRQITWRLLALDAPTSDYQSGQAAAHVTLPLPSWLQERSDALVTCQRAARRYGLVRRCFWKAVDVTA